MDDRQALRAQEVYRANQIQMASREQLLLITYDIGIGACKAAEEAIRRGDVEATNTALKRAQAVVRELQVTLDREAGGEVAEQLFALYDFFYVQLVEANVSKELDKVVAVRGMLQELRVTWQEAIEKLHSEATEEASLETAAEVDARVAVPVRTQAVPQGGFNLAG